MTYLQHECTYRRADSALRFNVGRVLDLKNPPASPTGTSKKLWKLALLSQTLCMPYFAAARASVAMTLTRARLPPMA